MIEAAAMVEVEARVHGEKVTALPQDLYIPPGALQVFLETFQGPLDLLLYLIKKQNIDILDIPVTTITRQYMEYVELMQELHLELAAEYLVMAAMLVEIKSRLLLPRPQLDEEDEGIDPRAELIRRLQEYERYQRAAEEIDELPRVGRDVFVADAVAPPMDLGVALPPVLLEDMLVALKDVMVRAELHAEHKIRRESLSIRERMTRVLSTIKAEKFTNFAELFSVEEGRMGIVVTLIAILELIRQSVVELVQAEAFAPIYIKAKG